MNKDKEFYLSLFPEDGPSICRHENCRSNTVRVSLMCAKHHFEMVMKKPCPFTYEDVELSKSERQNIKTGKLIVDSISGSLGMIAVCMAVILFGILIGMVDVWVGHRKVAWLEGDWVAGGIYGGIGMSLIVVCIILYQVIFAKADYGTFKRYSTGWKRIIIGNGVAGVCIGWIIVAVAGWLQLTEARYVALINILSVCIGSIIGLNIGLGAHKIFTRPS